MRIQYLPQIGLELSRHTHEDSHPSLPIRFHPQPTLSGVTTQSIVTRRLPHHKRLNVSMLTAIFVSWFTKPELERNLFPRISVQVEPERVESLRMERIGADSPASGFTVIAITVVPGGPSNK